MTSDGKRWSLELVRHTAAAVKAIRTSKGLTAAELSERTVIGKQISRAVISDLETGRKQTLDISELLTLAAALRVSPLRLLFPNVLEEVEILPGMTMAGTSALDWFVGQGPGPESEHFGLLAFGDDAIRFATGIAEIERSLVFAQHNLAAAERALEIGGAGSAPFADGTAAMELENAEHYQRQIKLLELERKNRVAEYERLIAGPRQQLELARRALDRLGPEHKNAPELRDAITVLEKRVAEDA